MDACAVTPYLSPNAPRKGPRPNSIPKMRAIHGRKDVEEMCGINS